MSRTAKKGIAITDIPFEVVSMILKEVLGGQKIEVEHLFKIPGPKDLAKAHKSLSILEVHELVGQVGEKILYAEATFSPQRITCVITANKIVRPCPLLGLIKMLHLDLNVLDPRETLESLQLLPNLESLTVSVSDAGLVVAQAYPNIRRRTSLLYEKVKKKCHKCMNLGTLARLREKYSVNLEIFFVNPYDGGVVETQECKVRISNARIVSLEAA